LSELGMYLRSLREKAGLTLREVEDRAGVSNAYLSLLESGKRPAPHPNILKRLSTVYEESLETLMRMAGYLDVTEQDNERLRVEKLFAEAIADSSFAFGHRYRGNPDFETKRFIAGLYEEVKKKRKGK